MATDEKLLVFECLHMCYYLGYHYSSELDLLRSYAEAGACSGRQFISLLESYIVYYKRWKHGNIPVPV